MENVVVRVVLRCVEYKAMGQTTRSKYALFNKHSVYCE